MYPVFHRVTTRLRSESGSDLYDRFTFPASAAAAPLAPEGPIQAIAADGTSITVMGVTVAIPATAFINSLARALTPGELADPDLPARTLITGRLYRRYRAHQRPDCQ